MPFEKITDWLALEEKAGSKDCNRAILATVANAATPHSRIVAIREIDTESILFFTQKGTRKTIELAENSQASMTFWLALQQRQIILEGSAKPLERELNEKYWQTIPRERQLRFMSYSPISSKPLASRDELDRRLCELTKQFEGRSIPMSEFYCGFRLVPEIIYFYTLGYETFPEVIQYRKINNKWMSQLFSP